MESTAQHTRLASEPLGSANALLTPEELTPNERLALAHVKVGADVLDPTKADTLRRLAARRPELLVITQPKLVVRWQRPEALLGACATSQGRALLISLGVIQANDAYEEEARLYARLRGRRAPKDALTAMSSTRLGGGAA